jgi:hypothetical protein
MRLRVRRRPVLAPRLCHGLNADLDLDADEILDLDLDLDENSEIPGSL